MGIDGGRFVDRNSGTTFVVRGTNYFRIVPVPGGGFQDRVFSPAIFDAGGIRQDFQTLAGLGYNTVRMFLDSCNGGNACTGNAHGPGLNPSYLDSIAEVTRIATEVGIMLLLTSNDLPDQGGYWEISSRDDSDVFSGYRSSYVLTASGTEAAVAYWDDLLGGLAERGAAFDAVLGWSILNEEWMFGDRPPLSLADGTVATPTGTYDMADPDQKRAMVVDGVRRYIAAVADTIKSHDPDGLVTMGFFVPQFPNPTGIGGSWYVDTAPLVADSALDFFDFHAYPGDDLTVAQMAENFGLPADKPVVMGEVGAFISRYGDVEGAGRVLQRWIADSCDVGWDGWLVWGYLRAPEAIGDATWALTDADGFLLQGLAPVAQPDPCTPTLEDPNLAHGAAVGASRAIEDAPPSNAVDGDPSTTWISGGGPRQWIEIDLGEPRLVGSIRLTVAQDPPGPTVHRVEVDGATVHTFEGDTADLDVLEYVFPEPVEARVVRIVTTRSPSWVAWREIDILAP